jgi:hypothetical protein
LEIGSLHIQLVKMSVTDNFTYQQAQIFSHQFCVGGGILDNMKFCIGRLSKVKQIVLANVGELH